MKKQWMLGALLALAGGLAAADLVDWGTFEEGKTLGSYADTEGSKLALSQTDGPAKGEKAVVLTANLKKWGGLWAYAGGQDLSQAGGLRFKAKAAPGGYLMVSLTDDKKIQVEATVRVLEGGWQDFALPMSVFHKSAWQQPDAPKDGVFNPAKVQTLNLSPKAVGKSVFTVGPLAIVAGSLEAQTGSMDGTGKDGSLMVQDFESLDAAAYGSFADEKGTKVGLSFKPGEHGKALAFDTQMAEGGWCGAWLRAGDAWGGQDWSGAKRLTLRVQSAVPVSLELAFNDANQNAYVAPAVSSSGGKGWQTLEVPFSAFQLNPYYQPPQAKKGAALDLSHVETFNINVKTAGKLSFLVDEVTLYKK